MAVYPLEVLMAQQEHPLLASGQCMQSQGNILTNAKHVQVEKAPHLLEMLVINQEHHDEQRQIDLHLWQQTSRFGRISFRPLGWACAGPTGLLCCAAHLQRHSDRPDESWGCRPGWHQVKQLPSEHSADSMPKPGVEAQAPARTVCVQCRLPCLDQTFLGPTRSFMATCIDVLV